MTDFWLVFLDEDHNGKQEALASFPYNPEAKQCIFRSSEEKDLYNELVEEKAKHPEIFTITVPHHEIYKIHGSAH